MSTKKKPRKLYKPNFFTAAIKKYFCWNILQIYIDYVQIYTYSESADARSRGALFLARPLDLAPKMERSLLV